MRVEARARVAVEQGERVLVEAALEPAPVGARRGAQRHDAAGDVHHVAGGAAVGVGAEVLGVGAVLLARVLDGGKDVALRERDERVGLVVLEVGVEERSVLVDEVLLQHERLVLVLHHEVVEAVDLVDQKRDLRALVLVVHVLAHAGAQLLRLAHVDDLAGLVLPQVHARQRGHGVQLLLDALELGGERIVGGGAIPALAHGAVERGPPPALALEALGVLGIERGLGIQALEPARVGRPEAVVHVKRGGSVVGFVEFVHTASIANRTSVPLGTLRSTRNAKGSPPDDGRSATRAPAGNARGRVFGEGAARRAQGGRRSGLPDRPAHAKPCFVADFDGK